MGCLPIPIAFLLGVGIGYWLGGAAGATWGAAAGLIVGGVGMGIMVRAMRRRD